MAWADVVAQGVELMRSEECLYDQPGLSATGQARLQQLKKSDSLLWMRQLGETWRDPLPSILRTPKQTREASPHQHLRTHVHEQSKQVCIPHLIL